MDTQRLKKAVAEVAPIFGWIGGVVVYCMVLLVLCILLIEPLTTALLVFAGLDLASAVVGLTYLSYRDLERREE